MKTKIRFLTALFLFAAVMLAGASAVTLDEILKYEITVDVNEDATLNLKYHIEWKVLDSTTEGPLTWVKIGIPNRHYVSLNAESSTISKISYLSDGGSYARIDFDKKYYKDDVVSFDFTVVQDYMYQVNKFEEGYAVYDFTPGWFDDICVDKLVIRWNTEKMSDWAPSCLTKDGYNVWEDSLDKGEHYTVTVTYPNDAFGFDLSKSSEEEDSDDFSLSDLIICIVVSLLGMGGALVALLYFMAVILYGIAAAFGMGRYDTKITRTKVVYWSDCPSCGAPREEGMESCKYCGRSLVKSEEIIKEEKVPEEDKEALKYKRAGVFPYSSSPNTYVRVNVVKTQRPAPVRTSSTSHHSSCAHSSCACACACACAGGGRAGCTTKDFYKGGFPLKYIK